MASLFRLQTIIKQKDLKHYKIKVTKVTPIRSTSNPEPHILKGFWSNISRLGVTGHFDTNALIEPQMTPSINRSKMLHNIPQIYPSLKFQSISLYD